MTDKKKFWVRQKAETSLYVESKASTEADEPTTEPESEPEAESEPKPEANDNPVDEAVKETGNKFLRIHVRIVVDCSHNLLITQCEINDYFFRMFFRF